MEELNDWRKTPIIHKSKIRGLGFLLSKNYIKEIKDGYYHTVGDIRDIELDYYTDESKSLAKRMGVENVDEEIRMFISKMNLYNELKDIGQSLIGKLAEIKGCTIKDLHEKFGMTGK